MVIHLIRLLVTSGFVNSHMCSHQVWPRRGRFGQYFWTSVFRAQLQFSMLKIGIFDGYGQISTGSRCLCDAFAFSMLISHLLKVVVSLHSNLSEIQKVMVGDGYPRCTLISKVEGG